MAADESSLEKVPADATEFCGRVCNKGDPNLPESGQKAFNDGVYGVIDFWSLTFNVHTAMCHHFTKDSKHCVTAGLGPEHANKCKGVLYGSKLSPSSLYCAEATGGHSPCNARKCPWVAAGKPCPYSEPKTPEASRYIPIGHVPHTPGFVKGDEIPPGTFQN